MTYDFTVIPGNSGIETNDLGLVLRYKDADDAVIDLTGSTLHFTADHGSANIVKDRHNTYLRRNAYTAIAAKMVRTVHGIIKRGE
ncbi:MAG: hypothetical protein P8O08_14545, partial [Paracoccaceae bacterium]|nr:hypothetical protein [Paracoccaceae bacterium]